MRYLTISKKADGIINDDFNDFTCTHYIDYLNDDLNKLICSWCNLRSNKNIIDKKIVIIILYKKNNSFSLEANYNNIENYINEHYLNENHVNKEMKNELIKSHNRKIIKLKRNDKINKILYGNK